MALAALYSLVFASACCIVLAVSQRDDRMTRLQQLLAQLNAASSCQGAGHSDGCCVGSPCTSRNGGCYCDVMCHEFVDCCDDIDAIGCLPPTATRGLPTSCSAAGFTGCCTGSECFIPAGNCACNESCHQLGNCCPDIEQINCPAPPTNCSAAGYTNGCCVANGTGDCYVPAGNCSCAQSCHREGNCCADITNINCQAPPPTCSSIGVTNGCCTGPASACQVPLIGGPRTHCYCGSDCHTHDDCCSDIDAIGCRAEILPTNCTSAGHTNGCCVGMAGCTVNRQGVLPCFCDVGCYLEDSCCEDIQQINCLPANCTEAGKTGCVVAGEELCEVTTSRGTCYCDANCVLGSGDCCEDALQFFQPDDRETQLMANMDLDFAKQMLYAAIQRRSRYYRRHRAMMVSSRSQK